MITPNVALSVFYLLDRAESRRERIVGSRKERANDKTVGRSWQPGDRPGQDADRAVPPSQDVPQALTAHMVSCIKEVGHTVFLGALAAGKAGPDNWAESRLDRR
jgi:hypothetical protein